MITSAMLKIDLKLVIFSLYVCGYFTNAIDSRPKLILVFLFEIDKHGLVSEGDRMAGSVLKSVDQAQAILPDFDLSEWEIIDSACDAKLTTRGLLALWNRLVANSKRIHGIIGPFCVSCCKVISLFAASYNIPVISYGCYFKDAARSEWFPTLSRVDGDISVPVSTILFDLIILKNIKKLAILGNKEGECDAELVRHVQNSIGKAVSENYPLTVETLYSRLLWKADPGIIVAELIHTLLSWKRKGYEVIFLAMRSFDTANALRVASSIGMLDGTISFVTSRYSYPEGIDKPNYPQVDEALMLAENGLLIFTLTDPESADYQDFMQEITDIDKHFDDPRLREFKPSRTFTADQLHMAAAMVYDGVILWAYGMKKALDYSWPGDGLLITDEINRISFQGLTGPIELDDERSRRLDWVLRVVQDNGTLVKVGDYKDKEQELTINHTALKSITWANGVKEMPGTSVKQPPGNELLIGIGCGLGVIAFGLILLCLFYRKFQIDLESQKTSAWLIHWEDIKLLGHHKDKSETVSRASFVSHVSFGSAQQMADLKSFESFAIGTQLTDFGFYKEKQIVVKLSPLTKMNMEDNRTRKEFTKIRKLHHENLNSFVGACVEPNHVCICMSYCSKGSVWNVIEKSSFSMTWHFRMALAVDIAKGMAYLHQCTVGSHGHLTSTNCVIDSRWTCKITDYGLCYIRRGQGGQQRHPHRAGTILQDEDSGDDKYYLWTAPELLRLVPEKRPLCGTQKADVFSYGIIFQEICFQQKPFGILLEEHGAYEVMSRVQRAEKPPFRPLEPEDKAEMPGDPIKFSDKWMNLMKLCWAEKPEQRPKFRTILEMLSRISGGQVIHAIDNMVKMMEIHTVRLEKIVHERSQELYEEKQRADSLLYSILPQVVAEQLKQGTKVLPEHFEAVTIFVSDIVKFTPFAAASTPIQVVTFLGLLYNMFDEIIDRNDVYKVETSGDTYIVASGIPTRNGNAHASEIANFSLQLLNSIVKFKVPHLPDKVLQIRIGIHTGPVLAGVVGQKMPRYCLFGHTESTAYLMEQNSPANSIHVSDTAYKLLNEAGVYRLVEHSKIDYEGKTGMQTYLLLGKILKRLSSPEIQGRRSSFSGRLPSSVTPPPSSSSDPKTPAASIDTTTRRPSLIDRILDGLDISNRPRRLSLPGNLP